MRQDKAEIMYLHSNPLKIVEFFIRYSPSVFYHKFFKFKSKYGRDLE